MYNIHLTLSLTDPGAFNSTKESERRSRAAQRKVDDAGSLVGDSESIRQQVDDLLNARQSDFDDQYRENEENLRDLNDQVQRLDDDIIDLNEAVSDIISSDAFTFRVQISIFL